MKDKEKAKEGKLAMKAELNMLFKPVEQKVPKGNCSKKCVNCTKLIIQKMCQLY